MSLVFYIEEEDNSREESVNNYKDLFNDYYKKFPKLSEALNEMFTSAGASKVESNKLVKDILEKCKLTIDKNYDKIKNEYPNITKEDSYIICSYTCESKETKFSPYRLLNKNLVSDNRKNGLKKITKYLFILIKTLRKLKRFYPNKSNNYLYRCITTKVNLSEDPFNEKYIPYKNGKTKIFWGFTSTSSNVKMTYNFLKDQGNFKSGTIFSIGGDIWGYNIKLFNFYGEEEILLEPERKYQIENILPPINDIIHITCKLINSPLILDDSGNNNLPKKVLKGLESLSINNNVIKVKFLSGDQNINCSIDCYSFDKFSTLVEKLYLKFPELTEKDIFFLYNGNAIKRHATVKENKIEDNANILVCCYDEEYHEEINKIDIEFISSDQKIQCSLKCNSSDEFYTVEKRLYDKFPKLKKKIVYFYMVEVF